MNREMNILSAGIGALDFMASRLLNFKRVQYEELCELTAKKFNLKTVELVHLLIEQKAIEQHDEALVVVNEEILRTFCLGLLNPQESRETRPLLLSARFKQMRA